MARGPGSRTRGGGVHSLPGAPVLPSPPHSLLRGGEAPQGGRPYENVMKPVEHMEPRSDAEAGEQQGMGDALVTGSTSFVNKCRGKYRIKMKGSACHGKARCTGI